MIISMTDYPRISVSHGKIKIFKAITHTVLKGITCLCSLLEEIQQLNT